MSRGSVLCRRQRLLGRSLGHIFLFMSRAPRQASIVTESAYYCCEGDYSLCCYFTGCFVPAPARPRVWLVWEHLQLLPLSLPLWLSSSLPLSRSHFSLSLSMPLSLSLSLSISTTLSLSLPLSNSLSNVSLAHSASFSGFFSYLHHSLSILIPRIIFCHYSLFFVIKLI